MMLQGCGARQNIRVKKPDAGRNTPANLATSLDIAENLSQVRARMDAACARAGRPAGSVTLLAVSKLQPVEKIIAAVNAGQVRFGENYVQEGVVKIKALQAAGITAEFHLIGALQKNKARDAAQFFSRVETVDSPELAAKLDAQCERHGRASLPVLLEVNLVGEAQKAGLSAAGAGSLLQEAVKFPRLEFRGLLAIPPVRPDPEESRADFEAMRLLFDTLRRNFPNGPPAANVNFTELSMGMSHDYEVAIECGATQVRVGTAIFGTRK
jgi:pyridoxal phosphate enzyme (YggS family)